MRRSQRFVHRVVWPLLILLLAIGFSLALYFREPP